MKKNVLFVGAFRNQTEDGGYGGQIFACNSLVNSDLKNKYNFILIDTTSISIPSPPLHIRLFKGLNRDFLFKKHLLFSKVNTVLLFSSSGFSFFEKGLMALIAKLFGKRVIFAPRSGLLLEQIKASFFLRSFLKYVIRSSDFWICQGEVWKKLYKGIDIKQPESKFVVINNWINSENYLKTIPKADNKDEELKILYLGWLEKYKGIEDFLNAVNVLIKKGFNIRSEIYGNGSLFDWCKEYIIKNNLENNVFMMGWANHETKISAFHNNDIFVLPSHAEGFPNVVLEAMLSGICVIASNVSSVPELIKDNDNGMIYEMKNVNQLIEKIEILNNDRVLLKNISENGIDNVMEKHSLYNAIISFKKIL